MKLQLDRSWPACSCSHVRPPRRHRFKVHAILHQEKRPVHFIMQVSDKELFHTKAKLLAYLQAQAVIEISGNKHRRYGQHSDGAATPSTTDDSQPTQSLPGSAIAFVKGSSPSCDCWIPAVLHSVAVSCITLHLQPCRLLPAQGLPTQCDPRLSSLSGELLPSLLTGSTVSASQHQASCCGWLSGLKFFYVLSWV